MRARVCVRVCVCTCVCVCEGQCGYSHEWEHLGPPFQIGTCVAKISGLQSLAPGTGFMEDNFSTNWG